MSDVIITKEMLRESTCVLTKIDGQPVITCLHQLPDPEEAMLDDNGVFFFLCPECDWIHSHGALAGHRVAHCTEGFTYNALGYVVVGSGRTVPHNSYLDDESCGITPDE